MKNFKKEVLEGLRKNPKRLPSKYFYDDEGSRIFQEIMDMPEYYLPAAELEIIQAHASSIGQLLSTHELDVIELGAGDGRKISFFLKSLDQQVAKLAYFPLDISESILKENQRIISQDVPGIQIEPVWGDFFSSLPKIRTRTQPRVIVFAGSNLGNFTQDQAVRFLKFIEGEMNPGDHFILGVDLKKNPKKVLAAYDDVQKITKRFNLNLLTRINRELGGNFELDGFDHYACYHPITGVAESFLVSLKNQKVEISGYRFHFEKDEIIQTEISQKYDLELLEQLLENVGLKIKADFSDSERLFSWVLFTKK